MGYRDDKKRDKKLLDKSHREAVLNCWAGWAFRIDAIDLYKQKKEISDGLDQYAAAIHENYIKKERLQKRLHEQGYLPAPIIHYSANIQRYKEQLVWHFRNEYSILLSDCYDLDWKEQRLKAQRITITKALRRREEALKKLKWNTNTLKIENRMIDNWESMVLKLLASKQNDMIRLTRKTLNNTLFDNRMSYNDSFFRISQQIQLEYERMVL